MTTTTATRSWVPVVAWTQVALGSAGLLAVLTNTTTGVVAAVVFALIASAHHAMRRASTKLDRILAEELDR